MLTLRSYFVKNTVGSGKDVAEFAESFKLQAEWYKNVREAIEKSIDANKDLSWDSTPAWIGINTRPEAGKRDGTSIKTYATIPIAEYAFIQHIPELAKELRRLSFESDDVVKIKFPPNLNGFLAHNDSIVVHFKKIENIEKVLKILDDWMKMNGISEAPREMGRTKVAADSSDYSFSELVARNIAGWLEKNAGKYDDAILASEAVRHAIEQSQRPPAVGR